MTSSELIASRIYFLRGERVLLDQDLAKLYTVETKTLKRQVRRNIVRFPSDFMFELKEEEWKILRYQFGTLGWGEYPKYKPFAFTEQGVAMLSGILKSPRAVQANIAIMRTFVALRKWMQSNKDLENKIRQLEGKYDQQFKIVFDTIRQLIREDSRERVPIGFKVRK